MQMYDLVRGGPAQCAQLVSGVLVGLHVGMDHQDQGQEEASSSIFLPPASDQKFQPPLHQSFAGVSLPTAAPHLVAILLGDIKDIFCQSGILIS